MFSEKSSDFVVNLTKFQIMEAKDRLEQVIRYIKCRHNINQDDIIVSLGYKKGSTHLSDMLSGRKEISEKFSEKLKQVYKVNPEYISSGVGDMFLSDQPAKGDPSQGNMMVNGNVSGNGNHISHNDSDNIAGMIELQKGYQELLKKSQQQIDRLIGIIEKGGKDES